METRKLQEVTGGTFTVSIPKEWATDRGFEGGMELQLYTHRDGSILVRSSDADVNCLEEATIDIGSGPEVVQRAVQTAYAVGFETITLRRMGAFTDSERKAARSTVRDLVGTDILTESETEITIRHLLDTSSVSIRQSIVQLQSVAVSLLPDAIETFVDAANTHARIRDRADEAHRSAKMVTRHFSRSLVSHAELDALDVSQPELFAYYAVARHLETVLNQVVQIASTGEKLPESPSDKAATVVCSLADDVACAVDDAVTAVLNEDMTKVQQTRDRCDDAIRRIEAAEKRLYDGQEPESVNAAVALSNTLSSLRRTANCGRCMADTAARTATRAENIDIGLPGSA